MEFVEQEVGQSKEMPARIVIYGEPKLGKSSFAAQADDVFFLNIEGGLSYLSRKVRSTPKLEAFEDVIAWLKHIYENDSFTAGTIAIDSADWLETLAQNKLIKQHSAKSITDPSVKDFAYFKGVMDAAGECVKILSWLDAIYKKKGIKSIIIAHSQIKGVDLPNQDPYSRHEMKLSKWFGARVNEWADLILYAGYSFHVTKDGNTTEPKRVLYAGGSASFIGGGRMALKKELPLDYEALKKEITQ
jgi:hypothetical protein